MGHGKLREMDGQINRTTRLEASSETRGSGLSFDLVSLEPWPFYEIPASHEIDW